MSENIIKKLVDEVNKSWGDGSLIIPELGGTMINEHPEVISTGCVSIDDALGIGGLPLGRIVEIMGQEACLDENTFIKFRVWDNNTGKYKNSKGGSIKRLYERFHKINNHPNRHNDVYFTVPSFNDNNCIFHNRIVNVVKTGKKECFEILTKNGLKIIASGDHKFFINNGSFIPLKKLKNGSVVMVHVNTTNKKTISKKQSYLEICVNYHPNHRRKIVTANNHRGEKVYSFLKYRVRNSHLVYEANQNGMSYREYRKLLNTAPSIVLDKLWTVPSGYEIHHIDENRRNDNLDNLVLIRARIHQRIHVMNNLENLSFILTPDTIINIKSVGVRETYDIKCLSPYNNYIANKFAVHNSGKSTLTLHVVANAQKKGYRCAFIDVEHALDTDRAKKIGVDFDKLAISQPDSGEQALEIVEYLIRSGQFKVIVIDSVAALIPRAELEGEMTDANIGAQARMMGKIMRKITAPTNINKVLVIFTNQVRAKLGGFGFIPQTTTPGGNALKFYASIRLDMVRTGNKKNSKKELLYTTHKATVKKNKLASPARVAEFKIGKYGIMNDVINYNEIDKDVDD